MKYVFSFGIIAESFEVFENDIFDWLQRFVDGRWGWMEFC